MIGKKIKFTAIYFVGPFGCYLIYQLLFTFRYLGSDLYPNFSQIYQNYGYIIELAVAAIALFITFRAGAKIIPSEDFKSQKNNLPLYAFGFLTIVVVGLIISNVAYVMGTLNLQYLMANFNDYYFFSTSGKAWMILLCYMIIYLILIDMYFARVNKINSSFLLINILIISINGGRGLLILFALAFLVMLLSQKISYKSFIIYCICTIGAIGTSYQLITKLREPAFYTNTSVTKNYGSVKPTDSYYDLNYNSAFIIDDVLNKMNNGTVTPQPYALRDALVIFIPRSLMPSKPISTGETYAVYPDVAKRGSNITFPLKANLIMHFGRMAYYFDWLVVIMFQIIFILGIKKRITKPGIVGFIFLFTGCAFSLIARGGILNARLLVQLVCIIFAYGGYLALVEIEKRRINING